ncbi:dentin sialophosphoprotein-like isoform X2 [Clinocottus analis]|uniref:dentin sialophosphoprotein-like isoform X2 n=1 Tax=Clinocottus analis TaxID=304258 RepID=UPI0035BF09CB
MAGVYLRSLLEKLSDLDKCKRGFEISETEVRTMLEHLELVAIELRTLENICLKMKKESLGIFGRKMQGREFELEKMKRKFQESQTETGFFRNIFQYFGTTGPDRAGPVRAGPDAENFSEGEDSFSTILTSATDQWVCTEWGSTDDVQAAHVLDDLFEGLDSSNPEWDGADHAQAADADDLDDLPEGEDFSSTIDPSATDQWGRTKWDGADDAQAAGADDLDDLPKGEDFSSIIPTSTTDQWVRTEWDSADDAQAADAADLDDLPEGEDFSSTFPTSTTDQWVRTQWDGADDAQSADADELYDLSEGEDSSSTFPTSTTDESICTEWGSADDSQAADPDDLDTLSEAPAGC